MQPRGEVSPLGPPFTHKDMPRVPRLGLVGSGGSALLLRSSQSGALPARDYQPQADNHNERA